MSDFVAGLGGCDDVFAALAAVADDGAFVIRSFGAPPAAAAAGGPRHFVPLDPDTDPTAGWNPLDATANLPESAAYIDPIAAARAAGYAEGLAAGTAAQQADGARDAAFARALAEALRPADSLDPALLAERLRQTVLLLVTRLVGEAGVSADLLAARVAAAAQCLADAKEPAMLRVHPDDVALLDGRLPANLFAAGDAGVARGSLILESASTIVEDGPARWLEQLAAAIDRVALPPC